MLTIDNILQASTNYNLFGVKSATATNNVIGNGLDGAIKRIAQQQTSFNVQLSAYGKIKSGFADLQTAGTALTKLDKSTTATTADLSKAAQTFVNAFNATTNVLSSATKKTGTGGALVDDNKAKVCQQRSEPHFEQWQQYQRSEKYRHQYEQ